MSPSTANPKIKLMRIAHVHYTHKNLDAAHQFLLDFGLSPTKRSDDTIYYRGYGTEPFVYCATKGEEDKFGGAGWVVESLEDLELATHLPNATPIQDSDAPGGGKFVTFYDPIDNCPWRLVYGQEPVEIVDTFPELAYNFPNTKHRPVNNTQRFKKSPAPIHKLGHFGLCVTSYKKALEFYTSHFNFTPSDIVYAPDTGEDITAFLHVDRGSEWVDHHSFFLFEGPKFHVHHSSFEVFDFDTQMLGHNWLEEKKYENCWGVGRHVLGSQIFDYWFDPSRFIVEHYVDGDLVNDETPITRTKATPDHLHVWGTFIATWSWIFINMGQVLIYRRLFCNENWLYLQYHDSFAQSSLSHNRNLTILLRPSELM
jgi:catechol 2,3-dioxygenase-like lactoylglutathione lyase family enzyme